MFVASERRPLQCIGLVVHLCLIWPGQGLCLTSGLAKFHTQLEKGYQAEIEKYRTQRNVRKNNIEVDEQIISNYSHRLLRKSSKTLIYIHLCGLNLSIGAHSAWSDYVEVL